jgi:hypothetical protein
VQASLNPRGWVIEGSNDGEKWTDIDVRNESAQKLSVHAVTHAMKYRFIRMRHIGASNGSTEFVLEAMEFFGSVENN